MLTRSKKKCTAGKDKSNPKNSNQECSTVGGSDAVGKMNHGGTSGGLNDDRQRSDYLQVAWLLREELNNLIDGDKPPGELPEPGLRRLLEVSASRHIIAVDPKMLNPVLWRTLPRELLLLVLARLPVPDITRLRSLSREWRSDMANVNSDMNRTIHEANPTVVALLSRSSKEEFFVTMYDINKGKWQHAYHLRLQRSWNKDWQEWPFMWTAVDACDGGLVCFLLLRKPTEHDPVCIVVVNLFTRVQHELPPPHYQYSALPTMVHIQVDLDHTKRYQVCLAAYVKGRSTIETYDSGTREWTQAAPPSCGSPSRGFIFGRAYNWTGGHGWCRKFSATPAAFDFAKSKLERYYKNDNPSAGMPSAIDSVLLKDRIFVLQGEPTQTQAQTDAAASSSHRRRRVPHDFCITEYHLQNQTTKTWVRVQSYECPAFAQELLLEVEDLFAMRLRACDDFLMVIVHRGPTSPYFWLLDLSTSEWRNLPEQPPTAVGLHEPEAVLCRAFWNVIP